MKPLDTKLFKSFFAPPKEESSRSWSRHYVKWVTREPRDCALNIHIGNSMSFMVPETADMHVCMFMEGEAQGGVIEVPAVHTSLSIEATFTKTFSTLGGQTGIDQVLIRYVPTFVTQVRRYPNTLFHYCYLGIASKFDTSMFQMTNAKILRDVERDLSNGGEKFKNSYGIAKLMMSSLGIEILEVRL